MPDCPTNVCLLALNWLQYGSHACVFATCARHVKEADRDIIAHVKAAGRLVHVDQLMHSYPYCWRSDTPLIYRAVPSWFVKVGPCWFAGSLACMQESCTLVDVLSYHLIEVTYPQ